MWTASIASARASCSKAKAATSRASVVPGFKAEVPGVEEATRTTFYFSQDRYLDAEGNVITGNFRLADSCFFKVFDRPILAGDPVQVLSQPRCLMVSESFANKLGGVEECLGKIIANEDFPDLKMTIEGVFEDFPKNGSLDFDDVDGELF